MQTDEAVDVSPVGPGMQRTVHLDGRPLAVLLIGIATMLPTEWRWLGAPSWMLGFEAHDVPLNLLLYLPLGLAMCRSRLGRTALVAFVLSCSAELLQLFMADRYSQPVDLLLDVAGAAAGWRLGRWLGLGGPGFRLSRPLALAAALAAAGWLTVCPSICGYPQGLGPLGTRFLERPTLGEGAVNAMIQMVFGLCHKRLLPNAALVGALAAVAVVGLLRPPTRRVALAAAELGAVMGGIATLLVWWRPGAGIGPGLVLLLSGCVVGMAVRLPRGETSL